MSQMKHFLEFFHSWIWNHSWLDYGCLYKWIHWKKIDRLKAPGEKLTFRIIVSENVIFFAYFITTLFCTMYISYILHYLPRKFNTLWLISHYNFIFIYIYISICCNYLSITKKEKEKRKKKLRCIDSGFLMYMKKFVSQLSMLTFDNDLSYLFILKFWACYQRIRIFKNQANRQRSGQNFFDQAVTFD